MELRWFYYRLSPLGKWSPQFSVLKPKARSTNGPIRLAGMRERTDDEMQMDLTGMAERYPPPSEVTGGSTH